MSIQNWSRFIAVLLASLCVGLSAELTGPEKSIIKVLETGRVNADLTLIPPEQLEGVIFRLREIAARKSDLLLGTTLVDPAGADLLLLRLGDTFTIERMMKDYRAYDSMVSWDYVQTKFERSRQPKLIPYLAEDFSSKEDTNKGITISPPPGSTEFAVGVPPRSIFSAVTAIRIIQKSSEFTPKMKAWADQADALWIKSPGDFRNLMQNWWEANKAAFERGDYLAVVPVAEEALVPNEPPSPSTPAATPNPGSQSMPSTGSQSTPTAQIDSQQKPSIWRWISALVVFLVIAAFVLTRRTSQK